MVQKMNAKSKKSDEAKRWLDKPENVRIFIRGFYCLCVLVILADFIFSVGWHKHAAFSDDSALHLAEPLPAFYGIYGFLACVGLVYASKLMRSWKGKNILMREEDYWDK